MNSDLDTGDIDSGFDRFGRVKDSRWYDYGSSADADRIKYGYDRNSNRLWRQNTVADALGKHFDELYGYDRINRLKDLDRGTLNGGKDGVTDLSFAECWALDQTGNWKNYRQDDDGSGTWDLNQHRSANTVNEITDISELAGPNWVTPAYNRAGNKTTMPQPADPTASYVATYDAWNRLVKLVDGSDTVSEYVYDGARRRVIQKSYVSGVLDETRHLFYTATWRNIEERVGSETTADKQFVWGLRYIDDIVLRDDTTQRLYGMQDANWNVTSVADAAGDVQERFAYSPYGLPTFLNASFTVQSSSAAEWETLYCGYRYETVSELFHIRQRGFHAVVGSWLQRDPFAFHLWHKTNAYISVLSSLEYIGIDRRGLLSLDDYGTSNPLNVTDADGLLPSDCTITLRCRPLSNRVAGLFADHCFVVVTRPSSTPSVTVYSGFPGAAATDPMVFPTNDPRDPPTAGRAVATNCGTQNPCCVANCIAEIHSWFPLYAPPHWAPGGPNSNTVAFELLSHCGCTATPGDRAPGFRPTIPPVLPFKLSRKGLLWKFK